MRARGRRLGTGLLASGLQDFPLQGGPRQVHRLAGGQLQARLLPGTLLVGRLLRLRLCLGTLSPERLLRRRWLAPGLLGTALLLQAPMPASALPPAPSPGLSPRPGSGPGAAPVPARGRTVRPAASRVSLQTVVAEPGRFLAWPANQGLWSWENGRELLVGYINGPWVDKPDGHKIGSPQLLQLARSRDGGRSWSRQEPDPPFSLDGKAGQPTEPIRFDDPDLAVRVLADGRKDPEQRLGRFYVSADRGHSWQGPYRFQGLEREPALRGLILTSRTSYLVRGPASILFLLSARDPRLGKFNNRLDKTFVAESLDGGLSFHFVSWVVPWSDGRRAVMPSSVDLGDAGLVTALRRRDPLAGEQEANWIDAYGSSDGGRSWTFLSRVGETGAHNGNPPALTRLRDGRLACAWADRDGQRMLLRLSADGGRSWGSQRLIRSNPHSFDMGYPQLRQNDRGELVLLYYLATDERPYSYIEAALIQP